MKFGIREIPERDEISYYMYAYQQEPPRPWRERLTELLEAFLGGYLFALAVMWGGGLL